ncbi:hypothetical protein F4804DRAFT_303433 [Jackrogersella minutella]|nr:hypothetical protein F4804DRAFT_303433 [Jackrogersella minutella]
MAPSTAELYAVMEATLMEFLENYLIAVRTKDVSSLSATLTPECTRHLKPANFVTAYPFIKAVETNADYEARMAPELALMEDTHHKVLNYVVDPVRRTASAYSEHWTKLANQEPTSIEICWYVDFTEDGSKISRIVEFIDTAAATRMVEELMNKGLKID